MADAAFGLRPRANCAWLPDLLDHPITMILIPMRLNTVRALDEECSPDGQTLVHWFSSESEEDGPRFHRKRPFIGHETLGPLFK